MVDLHSNATLSCRVNQTKNLTSEFVKWFVKVKTKDKIVYARNMVITKGHDMGQGDKDHKVDESVFSAFSLG
uniref:Ig-like domain-containing protein n=1 Tax=Knipowitschia caucasica TaxID=637954 RepID=A0AAV2KP53_KNICA